MKATGILSLVLLIGNLALAMSPNPEWYIRQDIMKALAQNEGARNLVKTLEVRNRAEDCQLDNRTVTSDESVTVIYNPTQGENHGFIAHYKCARGYAYQINLYGTFSMSNIGSGVEVQISGADVQEVLDRPGFGRAVGPCVEGDLRAQCVQRQ